MIWFAVVGLFCLCCFGFVLLFGAPYLPTLTSQVKIALELANLKPGQMMIELGCGDGKVLLAAAKQGIRCVGYELNPILFVIAWIRTLRYRKLVKVVLADFWHVSWPACDVVFVFLLDRYMAKLDQVMQSYNHKPVVLISFAFTIPDRKPTKQKEGIFAYEYR